MSSGLSAADLKKLQSVVGLLSTPFDFPSVDTWRSTVNRELGALLGADSAGFLLPESDGLFLYSDEHDPAALSRYPDLSPPPLRTGRSVFARMAELQVGTLKQAYGSDYDLYQRSEYYNDYAGANGAHDALIAMMPENEAPAAGIQLWHEHPTRRKFGKREVALMEILYPAMRAGITAHLRLARSKQNLLSVLDGIGQAVFVFDAANQLVHETPAVACMLLQDPEGASVRARVVSSIRQCFAYEIPTGKTTYSVRTFDYGGSNDALRIAILERTCPIPKDDSFLVANYGLTCGEIRVAKAIAAGKTNFQIAALLGISEHTVKRHTEKILRKLAVVSRSEVREKLF